MNFEILAPAGGMESLIAGVRSGANGVYLGVKAFNARRNAGNFDYDLRLYRFWSARYAFLPAVADTFCLFRF